MLQTTDLRRRRVHHYSIEKSSMGQTQKRAHALTVEKEVVEHAERDVERQVLAEHGLEPLVQVSVGRQSDTYIMHGDESWLLGGGRVSE